MTTKLIALVVVVAVLFGGWHLFLYWEQVKNEEETQRKEESRQITPESLPGLPFSLESSLQAAQRGGASGLRNWLKTYGQAVQDPRKAWIELDYVVAVAREDPCDARRVFATVRDRLNSNSPVWSRMKQLEKTYQ
jgi:hypothetical protein